MHRLMRNTHLILGLVFVLFLMVYGVSSLRVARRSWFPGQPARTESRVKIDPSVATSGRALGLVLMREHGLRGDLFQVQDTEEGFSLNIWRPGTNYEIRYSRQSGEAVIGARQQDFVGMLMGLHVTYGLWHDAWLHNLWGVFLLLLSVGLFLLGATGIYLCFKTYEERVIGSVLLGVGLVYGLTFLILTRQLG
jgi:hypothetical protein